MFALLLLLVSTASAQSYIFPTTAQDYGDWYPTAYKDEGGHDWNCGSIYYAGHNGSDFGGGGFAGMAEGRDIVAAAGGVVDYTNDGVADDCTTGNCPGGGGFGNYVRVLHADGKHSYYAHMKTWSLTVGTGDVVTCGQKLGEMGSSGNSTGPHLHFEVQNAGDRLDPFAGACSPSPGFWVDQGAHGALPGLTCDGDAPCEAAATLSCGVPVAGSNDAAGSSTTVLSYGCTSYLYSGPEFAWSWTAALSEPVTLSMTGLSADLDLFVTEGTACAPTACVASSISPQSDDEVVTFDAVAGTTYHLLVDGWEGATSAFQIELSCTGLGDDDDAANDDDAADDDDAANDDDAADDDDLADDDDALDDDDAANDDEAETAGPFYPEMERRSALGDGGEGCAAQVGGRGGAGLWLLLTSFLALALRSAGAGARPPTS